MNCLFSKGGRVLQPLAPLSSLLPVQPVVLARPQARWKFTRSTGFDEASLVPKPTPFVPDVKTFLTVIGRNLNQHASKFPSWEALFTLTSEQLRELGIEPARTRRYLIQWRERFRNGVYGIGGDLKYVIGGMGYLRVKEYESKNPNNPPARIVVNVPPGQRIEDAARTNTMVRVKGFSVKRGGVIKGPYALSMGQGSGYMGAKIKVTEGMWEHRRGHKIDGGERRRTETRFRNRIANRKAQRETRLGG